MNFHQEVLPKNSKTILPILSNSAFMSQFYLAGGTALALYFGHRMSGDFDFFSQKPFDESALISRISKLGKFQLEQKSEQTVIGMLNNVKLSFLGYNYPLLFPLENFNGLNIASVLDIACMKIDAIASRGTKRDFIDVYFIIKKTATLTKILNYFEKKYRALNYNMMHIKKSLVFFDDADLEPMPVMLEPVDWEAVKKFFRDSVSL